MKFRGHESFFIRKGWLYKGLRNVWDEKDIFTSKDAMEKLGLGNNMVRSLRYWLQAVGLTQEVRSGKWTQVFTEFGNLIWNHDRYMEELGTLWLLHLNLATNQELATAWYMFFNEFAMQEFQKEDVVLFLSKRTDTAIKSLESDFDCIINTYLTKSKSSGKISPENNIDCPLGELRLIDIVDKKKKIYKKVSPAENTLHPLILLSAILRLGNEKHELKIKDLLFGSENTYGLGKIFQLDMVVLMKLLYELEKLEYLKIIRTAGLDVVRIKENVTEQECIEAYYQTLEA